MAGERHVFITCLDQPLSPQADVVKAARARVKFIHAVLFLKKWQSVRMGHARGGIDRSRSSSRTDSYPPRRLLGRRLRLQPHLSLLFLAGRRCSRSRPWPITVSPDIKNDPSSTSSPLCDRCNGGRERERERAPFL